MFLRSAQPLHHVSGLFKPSLGDELVMKSLVRNVQGCHDFSFISLDMFHTESISWKEDKIGPRLRENC